MHIEKGCFMKNLKINENFKAKTIVLLNGKPGSGKSTLARKLSSDLWLNILSTEYTRQKLYKLFGTKPCEMKTTIVNNMTKAISGMRIFTHMCLGKSFVIDANFAEGNIIGKMIFKTYETIKIKINSDNDDNNIKRILHRSKVATDLKLVHGDKANDSVFRGSDYYDIINRSNYNDFNADYNLDNNGTLEEYKEQINNLIEEIKKH
jgi:cytidylate kinase